jgi:O-antigen/teichoic acid export membrane protein
VRIDVIMLSFLRGDVVTGWYSAAQRPIGMLAFVPAAFVGAVLPVISDSRLTPESIRRHYEETVKYLMILALPLAVGMSHLAPVLVEILYGPAYGAASPALAILAWTLIVTFLNHASSTCLIALGQERRFMAIAACGAAFNVATNVVLIPWLGHVGASLTTLATELLIAVLGYRGVRRRLGDVSLLSTAARPALAALVMGVFLAASPWQNLPLQVALGGVSYITTLIAVGVIRRQELTLPIRVALRAFRTS